MCPRAPDSSQEAGWLDVVVPSFGEAVSVAVLVAWWVEPNGRTVTGEPLFEVGTEKSVFRVEAEADGVLAQVLVESGEAVTPGMVVGRIRPR